MSVFTYISLLLATSGATYTASAAFRALMAGKVKEWTDGAEAIWNDHSEDMNDGERENAEDSWERAKYGRYMWHASQFIPVLLFGLLAFAVAFWVIGLPFLGRPAEDMSKLSFGWGWFTCLRTLLVVNLLSFFLSGFGVLRIRSCWKHMCNVERDKIKAAAKTIRRA